MMLLYKFLITVTTRLQMTVNSQQDIFTPNVKLCIPRNRYNAELDMYSVNDNAVITKQIVKQII